MQSSDRAGASEAESLKPPFLYEIRVKGRLSREQWTSWFDDLTLANTGSESLLRGSVPDHAALYGLLARLRDLAVPLVTVRVLDAEAQTRMYRQSRRYDLMINLLLVLLYLTMAGGLATITVFIAPTINVALVLALLAAALGGLAHAFALWSGQQAWRWVTYITWVAAVVAFLVFIPLSGILPVALGIAIMLFLVAGAVLYLIFYLRRGAESIKMSLAGEAVPLEATEAEPAGDSADSPVSSERALDR